MVETLRSLKDKYLCPPVIGYDSVVEEVIPNYDPKSKTKPRRDPEGLQMLDCPEYLLADLELSTAIEEDF